ncbi:MAG TPA: LCP family protein [Mycobacteriales bacterium]|nr:LCP family protein [Mycobacteriales bacterium]
MTGKRRADREPDPARRPASLIPPAAPEVYIQPAMTRREERRLRQRRQRRKYASAGGVVIAALAVAAGATLVLGVHHVVTHKSGPTRTQVTVLLQLTGSDGSAAGSVLLAADPQTHEGLEVLVPGQLITDVCGYGAQDFGEILGLPNGETASRAALSNVLDGVTIDGSWILTPTQLARLVDEVGGITVDVDTDVVQHTTGGGGTVVVAAGAGQHLSGAQAVAYATYQSNGGAAAGLERMQRVVDGLVQALPRTAAGVEALVRQLGSSAQPTDGVAQLSQMLVELAAEDQTEAGVFPTDLPVTPIDAGAASPSYRPDDSATGIPSLVQHRLSASLPASTGNQHATVLLLNGVGVPGLVGTACPKLAAAGFTYSGSGNAPTFSQAKSQVDIFSNADVEQGDALAKALGLPDSDVRRSVVNQDVAKFVVILGSDYRP